MAGTTGPGAGPVPGGEGERGRGRPDANCRLPCHLRRLRLVELIQNPGAVLPETGQRAYRHLLCARCGADTFQDRFKRSGILLGQHRSSRAQLLRIDTENVCSLRPLLTVDP